MTATNQPDPFLASGISLGIPNTSASTVEQIDNALFLDSSGNLQFTDAWIKTQLDVEGAPLQSVSLKDLWTRNNGVFVKDGQLYFKDSTVGRAYSLKEIVSSYKDWKNKLTNGGIYWIGRTSVTNAECENIMVDVNGTPTITDNTLNGRIFTKTGGIYPTTAAGTKVFSIDQYLIETVFTDGGDFRRTPSGEFRWHDVPSLKIIIPPVSDTKLVSLFAKTSLRLIGTSKPILFRLYDKTTSTELDRIAMVNSNNDPCEQQPTLAYSGVLPTYQSVLTKLACQCPSSDQTLTNSEEPAHEIVIQFYVDDHIQTDIFNEKCDPNAPFTEVITDESSPKYKSKERRLFGLPNAITSEPVTNSSIQCIIFDVTKTDIVGRKSGSVSMVNTDTYTVTFDKAFSSSDYSITLSSNKNINTFYSSKTNTGFVIRASKKFTGSIDWVATKLNSEGVA